MNIIVCIKQVPNTNMVKIDPEKGTLIREGVESIINPDDLGAIEQALDIKDKLDNVKITLITMGPKQAEEVLLQGIAMGCDDGILLSDRAFAGADTWATSYTIASAIKKIGNYDLIFCGRQAIDGDTAQVGPQIAERLNVSQITYVKDMEINGDKIRANRLLEDGYEVLEANFPLLVTTVKEIKEPRYPSIKGIRKAFEDRNIKMWTNDDLNIESELIGLKGSPTKVHKSFTPDFKKSIKYIEKEDNDLSEKLTRMIKEKLN